MQIDPKLIKHCLKDDRKAQRQLFDLCFPVLMSVCMRYTKNEQDARSFVNSGILRILNKLDKYHPDKPFEAWIRRIMINIIIDDYRKNKKYYKSEWQPENGQLSSSQQQITLNEGEARLIEEDIYRYIRQLPGKTAAVFNLYVIDGYRHSEIAEQLDISIGTSKWHLSDARKRLKKMITKSLKSEQIKL